MPIEQHLQHSDYEWAIWKIAETETELFEQLGYSTAQQTQLASEFPNSTARLQFLASRCLIQTLTGQQNVQKDEFGKPFLPNFTRQISISHSAERCAVLVSKQKNGIDIQQIHAKVTKLAPKFLNNTTLAHLSTYPTDIQLELAWIYWGAKEALFKAYGKGQLDFKTHLHVQYLTNYPQQLIGQTTAFIAKNNVEEHYTIFYQKLTCNYILVFALLQGD